MRHLHLPVALFIALVGTVIGSTLSTGAQEATPVAGPIACDGPQVTPEELLDLWFGTTLAPDGSPEADEAFDGVVIPIGEAADEATAAEVEATVRAVFACFDAGDILRAFAYFTDDLKMQFGPEPGTTREEAEAFLTEAPEPAPPGEDSTLVAVTDVMLLDDGRVGAFVIEQSGDEFLTSYAIFENVDGQWLVDQVIEFTSGDEEE